MRSDSGCHSTARGPTVSRHAQTRRTGARAPRPERQRERSARDHVARDVPERSRPRGTCDLTADGSPQQERTCPRGRCEPTRARTNWTLVHAPRHVLGRNCNSEFGRCRYRCPSAAASHLGDESRLISTISAINLGSYPPSRRLISANNHQDMVRALDQHRLVVGGRSRSGRHIRPDVRQLCHVLSAGQSVSQSVFAQPLARNRGPIGHAHHPRGGHGMGVPVLIAGIP